MLTPEEGKRLCTNITISRDPYLKDVKVKDLMKYVKEPLGCKKETIRTPKKDGSIWKSKKLMIYCRPFSYLTTMPIYPYNVARIFVDGFHLSASNQKNAVFVFRRNVENDNLEIEKLIENLTFEPDSSIRI